MTNDIPCAFSWKPNYDQAFINQDSEKVIYTVDDFVFLADLENHEIDRTLKQNCDLDVIVKASFDDELNDLDRDPENWQEAELTVDPAWI